MLQICIALIEPALTDIYQKAVREHKDNELTNDVLDGHKPSIMAIARENSEHRTSQSGASLTPFRKRTSAHGPRKSRVVRTPVFGR